LSILVWHECINDTLGGVPIAVTYCPLCDSAFVFDRRVGSQVREFGISGLLFQSNVVLYDRQASPNQESLWTQVGMRAIAGPAAAQNLFLSLVDSSLTGWSAWNDLYPQTTVVSQDTGNGKAYGASPYGQYFSNDQLMFPVHGKTGRRPDLANKDRVVMVTVGGAVKAYPTADIMRAPQNVIVDRLGGISMAVVLNKQSGSVDVLALDDSGNPIQGTTPVQRAYTFWFVWDAMYPTGEVYQP
jgi:hypothetical protein